MNVKPSVRSVPIRAYVPATIAPGVETPAATASAFDETMAQVLADDVQVYAVRTGNSDSPNLHDLAGARRLEEFAAQTGGAVYVPRTHEELAAAFKQIATDLSQQYVLSYYPSGEQRDGRLNDPARESGTGLSHGSDSG